MTANLFGTPELISVFLQILALLWSGCSRFVFWYSVLWITFVGSWRLFQVLQLQLVSPLCSALCKGPSIRLAFQLLLFSVIFKLNQIKSIYYYLIHFQFFTPASTGGISLESEWHQVSSYLCIWSLNLRIPAHLKNSVIWIVSIIPLIFNSSSLFSKPLRMVPSALTTISITVTVSSSTIFFYFSGKAQIFVYLFFSY